MTQPPLPSPFPTCAAGHDLTERSSWFYDRDNHRRCRACNAANPSSRAKVSTFTPLWADQGKGKGAT